MQDKHDDDINQEDFNFDDFGVNEFSNIKGVSEKRNLITLKKRLEVLNPSLEQIESIMDDIAFELDEIYDESDEKGGLFREEFSEAKELLSELVGLEKEIILSFIKFKKLLKK